VDIPHTNNGNCKTKQTISLLQTYWQEEHWMPEKKTVRPIAGAVGKFAYCMKEEEE
jgi:hypothetical protein